MLKALEGAKDKPYSRREFVSFIRSDAGLICLFLEFLRRKGYTWPDLRLSVAIHDSADVDDAQRWWAQLIGADASSFAEPGIKRHVPRTNRKGTGESYVGCLTIGVRGSRDLYQEIEGEWRGIAAGWASQGS